MYKYIVLEIVCVHVCVCASVRVFQFRLQQDGIAVFFKKENFSSFKYDKRVFILIAGKVEMCRGTKRESGLI